MSGYDKPENIQGGPPGLPGEQEQPGDNVFQDQEEPVDENGAGKELQEELHPETDPEENPAGKPGQEPDISGEEIESDFFGGMDQIPGGIEYEFDEDQPEQKITGETDDEHQPEGGIQDDGDGTAESGQPDETTENPGKGEEEEADSGESGLQNLDTQYGIEATQDSGGEYDGGQDDQGFPDNGGNEHEPEEPDVYLDEPAGTAGDETQPDMPLADPLDLSDPDEDNSPENGALPVEEGPNPLTTQTDPNESLGKFEQKQAPGEAIKSKPNVLNRQFILYIIGGVVIFFVVFFMYLLPLIQDSFQKKTERRGRQSPESVNPSDYSAMVPRDGRTPRDSSGDYAYTGEYQTEDEILETLPPIDTRYQNQNNQPQQTPPAATATGGGGGIGYVRPDTRTDRLQSKSISGIKGLTPTQRQYLEGNGQVPYAPYPPGAQPIDPANPYAQFGMPTKEEYTQQAMAQYAAQASQQNSATSYSQQNDQGGKMAFYNQGRENSGNGYWLPPTSIWQGTIFEATLTSRINTDLPGECTAMVSKNIYSSLDGKYLLIPQNSRLLGSYNSSISYSQSRVQVGWHTLIRPDGYYVNLGNMQATDPRGATGLPGLINDHPFQYLKAIALLSAMNIINSELSASMANSPNQYVQNVMANTQDIANVLGGRIIDRALDVQPTITIREGTKINIVVNNTLVLPAMTPYPVKYPYHRGQ